MTAHDPLCAAQLRLSQWCICPTIAEVRADERERSALRLDRIAAAKPGGPYRDALHHASLILRCDEP